MVTPRKRLLARHRLAVVSVLGLTAVLFFARLGDRALWSEEVRWAEIPREMLGNGDLFWPTFNGRVYYDKPLGSYWLVLIASKLTGEVNELAARLPSAVSGIVAVVLLMLIARRLYNRRVAVLAGAILATSFGFTVFARTAAADAENVAGVLAALWLFVRHDGRPGRWVVAFWLVMALTSLTKGLLGFALPLVVVSVYSTWAHLARGDSPGAKWVNANKWLFNRTTLIAAPLAVAIYFAPFLLSAGGVRDGLAMVYRENIRRFFDPVNHRGPIYLYAYVIFGLLAPWSFFLPAALVRAHRSTFQLRPGPRFAVAYFWATFLFFTLSSSRRSYYLLPVLPAGALLVAALLARPGGWWRRAGIGFAAAAVLVLPVVLVPPTWRPAPLDRYPELPAAGMFVMAWAVAGLAMVVAVVRPRLTGGGLVLSAFAGLCYVFVVAQLAVEGYRTQRPFAAAVREQVGADAAGLALFRTSDVVYYLDPPRPLPEIHDSGGLSRTVDVRWLIVRRRDRAALGGGWADIITEPPGPWDGADGAATKLILVRRTG
jgi:4-amino-4-deoxy-L-arabinose transferase-like glycosyltransferase